MPSSKTVATPRLYGLGKAMSAKDPLTRLDLQLIGPHQSPQLSAELPTPDFNGSPLPDDSQKSQQLLN